MRIKAISLSWFRGAAADATLIADGGSVMVFGTNGSGKSSFVDAIEACIGNGKVTHLSHEYSGRHQEKGLINTHRPEGASTVVSITLADGTPVVAQWNKGGVQFNGGSSKPICDWNYRRTALRQEEMALFIKATKAEKYSAIVPLLGLGHIESVADNLHKIGREIEITSKVSQLRLQVAAVEQKRKELFPDQNDEQLNAHLDALSERYVEPAEDPRDPTEIVSLVLEAINARLASMDASSREAAALQELSSARLVELISKARQSASHIAALSEPLIKERLGVIDAAADYCEALTGDPLSIVCPACGSDVPTEDFRNHLASERARLVEAAALFQSHRNSLSALCDEVGRLIGIAKRKDLESWRQSQEQKIAAAMQYISTLELTSKRTTCAESDFADFELHLGTLIDVAKAAGAIVPPSVEELIRHRDEASCIRDNLAVEETRRRIVRIDALAALIQFTEAEVRQEITSQAKEVFGSISTTIQQLWDVIHPEKRISEVRLHVPKDGEKAIDVALRFHGVDQESPRLTLSEGQRNGLGLCIFLALAKKEGGDCPLILDDVVVSLDRDHRSHVAKLLSEQFQDRQIFLLTHDREWFFELQRFLPRQHWRVARLLPFVSPVIGIRLADDAGEFEKARTKVHTDPEDAEANVRRIMDLTLSEASELLEVPVPHLRGDANDHRSAGQFIGRIISRADKSFKKVGSSGEYEKHSEAIDAFKAVEPQLTIWLNRATHTFSASSSEAATVITNCERACGAFHCSQCGTPVWYSQVESTGDRQCRCSALKWKA